MLTFTFNSVSPLSRRLFFPLSSFYSNEINFFQGRSDGTAAVGELGGVEGCGRGGGVGGLIDTSLEPPDVNQNPVTLCHDCRQLGRRHRRRRHSQGDSAAAVPLPVPGRASLSSPPALLPLPVNQTRSVFHGPTLARLSSFLIPHVKNRVGGHIENTVRK